MALIPDVKCSRCDQRYSGLRSKCPYCGAIRAKKGRRVSSSDNSTLKLVIGVLLIAVLIAAIVLIVINPSASGGEPTSGGETSSGNSSSVSSSDTSSVDSSSVSSETASSSESSVDSSDSSSSSSSSSENDVTIISIVLTYDGKALAENDITLASNEVLPLGFETDPANTTEKAQWESSDIGIFTVTQEGKLTAISSGEATLTVTVGDTSVDCIIRVQ